MTPAEGRALAVRLLAARGFSVSGRNARGDSVYLTAPGGAVVRVSNHPRTPAQRLRHSEVATSLVIRAPRSPAQIAAMVAAAARAVLGPPDRPAS